MLRVSALIVLLASVAITPSSARLWTTITGQTFEAEFVRVEGGNGIFLVRAKEYPYPLNRLSIPDRLAIGKLVNQQGASPAPASATSEVPPETQPSAAPAPAAGGIELAGQALKLGGEVEIEIPIVDPAGLRETRKAYGKPSDKARLLIAVPEDFAPAQKTYPLLIVSATADGAASSIGSAHQFVRDALENGFVVLAVDGEFGKPTTGSDSTDFRWALVSAALDVVDQDWPQAKDWPIATGGVSGGGGYASHQALKLAAAHARLIGLFLSVCPWNPTKFPDDLRRVPFSTIRDLPIFMSVGEKDEVVGKEVAEESHAAMVKKGFKQVRFEQFDGGHQLNHPHLLAALACFLERHPLEGSAPSLP